MVEDFRTSARRKAEAVYEAKHTARPPQRCDRRKDQPMMLPSSSPVQDVALSRRKLGFESPWQHKNKMYSVPISIKGVVIEDGKVWLRKNERGEWELPGGKLDKDEQPETTVMRELKEELGFNVEVKNILQSYLYTIKKSADESHGVLVVTYLCKLIDKVGGFELIGEAGKAEFEKFSAEKIEALTMPQFYEESIKAAFRI